ncbi:MAG: hypothetical protein EB033_13870 [Proteobacteria bacterium]|nr:hypothetical protein [Pseudomonadota bacterium]
MALRTGNGMGGLFIPIGMRTGWLPDARGPGRWADLGRRHDVGAWDCLGWWGRKRSITVRRRDTVQSTERIDRLEMRGPGVPMEA